LLFPMQKIFSGHRLSSGSLALVFAAAIIVGDPQTRSVEDLVTFNLLHPVPLVAAALEHARCETLRLGSTA